MRALAALAILATSIGLPDPGHAQDFVGFDRASFGRVVLNRTESAGIDDIEFELSVGDYNNEPIQTYSPTSIFRKMGLSVGRLDILTDNGVFPCTAFIVDEKHLLTNHHCVPGILDNERAKATRIDSVMFVAGYVQQGVEEGTQRYTVIPTPVETSKDLDYSVLEVIGDPSADFGHLRLASAQHHDNDPYLVIGHPMGEAQRISREKCRANAPAISNQRLLHTCDTLPGNSGSPVIDAGLQMVVGLHHAGSKKDSVNFAIPMTAILEQSQVLKAALADAPVEGPVEDPGPDTAPDPVDTADPVDPVDPIDTTDPVIEAARLCDALYNEAKAFGQCFAYEAYLETCAQHSYAIFARSYVTAECSDPADDPIAPPPGNDPVVDHGPLRPWCNASVLNTAERTICGDAYLAGLDEKLERAYGSQSGVSTASQQNAWRTGTRDACGSNASCLSRAMIDRIAYLETPPAPRPDSGKGYRIVRGNHALTNGECYIVTASRPSVEAAIAFAQEWFPNRHGIRIFGSDNGYYGVIIGTTPRGSAEARIASLVSGRQVPADSYCSTGSRYVLEVLRGDSAPAPGSYTMYVDNNASGGLNVRRGPGTNYGDFTEIAPGTQVTVLRDQGDWSNIRLPDGQTGWVYRPLLTSATPHVRQCTARVVNLQPYSNASRANGQGFLNIRADDSPRSRILSEAYLGDQLKVLAQKGSWARVRCISGLCNSPYRGTGGATGWASKTYLSIRCQ